ncbi:zinc ribbon domain-containing protein [Thermoflexus sp.]|uniref:double zinc ribbon domain-containing protein n=1 Tax=Thermoflexus sp. TaxID=1969742 RepID=UPI0035E40306
MKSCPICGASNSEDRLTCEQCGASLIPASEVEGGVLCPICGYRNPSAAIFCEQCGARLESGELPEIEGLPVEEELESPELDWLATLGDLFPEIPPTAPSVAPEVRALETGGAEEAPAPPEETRLPEVPLLEPWEGAEGETPSAQEPAAFMPSMEEPFQAFEPEHPTEELSVPPFEGLPPEIAAPTPPSEPPREEQGAFPFPGISPEEGGQEIPFASEGEPALAFPWLETSGEALEQGPEVSLPETAPFIGLPSEWEAESSSSFGVAPFAELPPEVQEELEAAPPVWPEAEAIPEWLREWGEEGKPSEPPEEAVPEVPFVPFEGWEPEEEASMALEIPRELPIAEEGLTQVSPFLVEELPAESPPVPVEVPPFTDLEEVLAEMPEWLQTLQPVSEEEVETPLEALPPVEQAVVETQGPLAGLVDVLPLNLRMTEIQGPAARLRAEPAPELLTRAQAWQSLLDQGLTFLLGERVAGPAPAALGAALERWLLFILLLGALILGLYWPLPFFQTALLTPPVDFLSALDQAPPGGIALVAVDYGPDRAAELEVYLQRVLERLTARGVRVLTVSLSPWGAAQAAQVVQARPDYGERVVHLGYYPGQEMGVVRLLTRPIDQLGVDYRGQSLRELPIARDFEEGPLAARLNLVVLITGSPDALRGWIQQVHGILPAEVPRIAAVGANLAPYVAPYRESGQLQAAAVGLRDALLMEGPVPEGSPAFFDLQAQATLQVFVVLLIGAGLVIQLFRGSKAV